MTIAVGSVVPDTLWERLLFVLMGVGIVGCASIYSTGRARKERKAQRLRDALGVGDGVLVIRHVDLG